ncbi:tail fiber protein [Candidatus Accumulibacter phosphatis]|uniref:tail fiber protein n=1 Tax=Candidatus Accumulibacter phosphatis TaxID=327160 RepID=UPI0039B8F264
MMMRLSRFALLGVGAAFAGGAHAIPLTTDLTGGGVAFDNRQPSLAVTQVLARTGIFPTRDSGFAAGDTLGFVYSFAGNFTPGTTLGAQGQLLPIGSNAAVFSLLGTTYGGNGVSNFALPDTTGRAIVGAGSAPGLSPADLGLPVGSASVSLTTAQLPAHAQPLAAGGATGGNLPFDNRQPSLPLQRVIASTGFFPSRDGGGGSSTFLGQVATFAGTFVPGGWLAADGSLLSIAANTALFSLLGTTYGGDGRTTFALPDLRGRISVGASDTIPLGMTFGEESTTLTVAQLPAHAHPLPGGGATGSTGGSAPVDNAQPSLALNYLIAIEGIFPSSGSGAGFDQTVQTLGQITEFAGNFAPGGWAFAAGQILSILDHEALFSILGTTYGGDGVSTFALPDLRGRTTVGTGPGFPVGEVFGRDTNTLSIANLAPHAHTLPEVAGIPEPATLALVGLAMGGLGFRRRRQAAKA